MTDAMNLALQFITGVMNSVDVNSPIMFVFGLAIVVGCFRLIFEFTSLGRGKGV